MKPVCTAWHKIKYDWFEGDIIDELTTFAKDYKRGNLVNCRYYRQFIGKPLMAYFEQPMLNMLLYRYTMLKDKNATLLMYDNSQGWEFFDDDKNTSVLCDMIGMTNEDLDEFAKRNNIEPLSKGSCQWYRTQYGDVIIVCWSLENLDYDFLNLSDVLKLNVEFSGKTYMGHFYEMTIPADKIKNYGGVITEQ